MFNRVVVLPGKTQTNYVTREVHEHRAPTDQSVALLKEMEEAAKDKVVDAVHVQDTAFSCEVHLIRESFSMQNRVRVIFSIGGRKMHEDVVLSHDDDGRQLVEKIREAVAQRIAGEVLTPALRVLDAHQWRTFSGG